MSKVNRYGAVTVFRPTTPIDHENVIGFDEVLSPNINTGVPFVVLDLAETPLLDGTGLEWILQVDEYCCRRGGCVRVCSVNELCGDIMRITRVGKMIESFDDLAGALASFN